MLQDQPNMSSEQLAACPFCGGEAFAGTTLDNGCYVMCRREECWGMAGYLQTEAEAITAWNTRVTAPTRDGEVGREVQSVWRCAIGDATGALDILKNEWLGSRRKADRHAGQVLSGVLNLVWAARNPAPKNYSEANDSGKRLHALVSAALATQAEDGH